ncbi:hypothetical protein RFI_27499 [Reticulomyxa filosa]|uniref:Uncharacterized protein n=1 Tax=Reticulomyxa filosa TaxID=46433 RepID=X6M7D9_RETFI|nr:hypothetical protein RFI_27499 [Reticulomyxa filosa]|eukprot:ETO09878.1 hypothetical protein RFI_27499 [Reticulomyxa filosa]
MWNVAELMERKQMAMCLALRQQWWMKLNELSSASANSSKSSDMEGGLDNTDLFFELCSAIELSLSSFRRDQASIQVYFTLSVRESLRVVMEVLRCIVLDYSLTEISQRMEKYYDAFVILREYEECIEKYLTFWTVLYFFFFILLSIRINPPPLFLKKTNVKVLSTQEREELSMRCYPELVVGLETTQRDQIYKLARMEQLSMKIIDYMDRILKFFYEHQHHQLFEYLAELGLKHQKMGIPSHILANMASAVDKTLQSRFDDSVWDAEISDTNRFIFTFCSFRFILFYFIFVDCLLSSLCFYPSFFFVHIIYCATWHWCNVCLNCAWYDGRGNKGEVMASSYNSGDEEGTDTHHGREPSHEPTKSETVMIDVLAMQAPSLLSIDVSDENDHDNDNENYHDRDLFGHFHRRDSGMIFSLYPCKHI